MIPAVQYMRKFSDESVSCADEDILIHPALHVNLKPWACQ
jgi:hypothetical protein